MGREIDLLDAAQAFFASPLERARETMEIARAAMGLEPEGYRLDPVLKELFRGWERLTWPEIEAKDAKAGAPAARIGGPLSPRAEKATPCSRTACVRGSILCANAFVISHGGVARVLMALIAGVPPAKAVDAPIIQGRAIVFENGGCRWLG